MMASDELRNGMTVVVGLSSAIRFLPAKDFV
jgi:hypothetical protein